MGDDLLGERTTDDDSLNKTQQRNRTKNGVSKWKMASYDKKTKVTTTNIKIKNYTWHIYWYSQLHNWNTNEGKMQTREKQARNQSKTHSVVNDL